MIRYKLTYKIVKTEEEAKNFCDNENKNYYIRKNHQAHFTAWSSSDGKEHGFIIWYVTK